MAYNYKIGTLKPAAMYRVSLIDNWDGSTETKEMDGATLASFTNAAAHLYDIHAEEIKPAKAAKISISPGNSKMGYIPSISLPPIRTCAHGCTCAKKCYAAKLCRLYPNVRNAYERNLDILLNDDMNFWHQVNQAVRMSQYFRFHVSGDIVDSHYFNRMVTTAEQNPNTTILAFTKQYEIVNNYLNIFGYLPENLKIIFSAWPGMPMENPHNMPVAHVIFKGETPAENWKICGGNCSECACRGVGCWELKHGEHIAFYEH